MNKEEKKKLLEKTILDHQTMLYRIAFSIVKEEQAALDVVQETIVKAYSQIGQLRQPEYIRTWLVRICINEANGTCRKQITQRQRPGIAAGISGLYPGCVAGGVQRSVSSGHGFGAEAADGDHPALL